VAEVDAAKQWRQSLRIFFFFLFSSGTVLFLVRFLKLAGCGGLNGDGDDWDFCDCRLRLGMVVSLGSDLNVADLQVRSELQVQGDCEYVIVIEREMG
jgi:hypothetical protein